jgi:hypothetical protein
MAITCIEFRSDRKAQSTSEKDFEMDKIGLSHFRHSTRA